MLMISLVEGAPVSQLLEDREIQVMQWSPLRPDMNLGPYMKYVWAHVMRELSHSPPTTFRQLRVRVHHIFDSAAVV